MLLGPVSVWFCLPAETVASYSSPTFRLEAKTTSIDPGFDFDAWAIHSFSGHIAENSTRSGCSEIHTEPMRNRPMMRNVRTVSQVLNSPVSTTPDHRAMYPMRIQTILLAKPIQHRACVAVAAFAVFVSGCKTTTDRPLALECDNQVCSPSLQKIEVPGLADTSCDDLTGLMSGPPMTISNFYESDFRDLTLDEAIVLALQNGKVLQRLGGAVVNAPQAAATSLDQAIFESNALNSPEAALSAFDAQVATSLFFNHNERKFNNTFQSLFSASRQDTSDFQAEMFKQTATGTRFAIRTLTDYTNNHVPPGAIAAGASSFRFSSVYNTVNQLEIRQPLLRGAGAMVNGVAGPSGQPGVYNGVMIARIRSDISLADFEAGVRDLIRDVEGSYWELYFAFRDLDTKLAAREAGRETWENRQIRFEKGVGRPDEEAQARQQFYNFENQVQNALTGQANGSTGLLGAERNLRRLVGFPVNDGLVIRPVTEPAIAPAMFDWQALQESALERRVELRRQKWIIKQRELEYMASKQLNKWQLDLVGQYGFRGFGDNLFGSRGRTEGSAVADLFQGDLDDYQVGLQYGGPIGKRQGHLAVRSAELQLIREKTILREQQKQILHDLGAAYTEVDRALSVIKTSYNIQVAAREELGPKRLRVEEGKDQVFFLLDAQTRYANSESAFYRSIVDYNIALMNLSWTSGQLLNRYNIQLDEGPWDESIKAIGTARAADFESLGGAASSSPPPVSNGPYNQSASEPTGL